jgi:hypothetical protein
VPTPSLRKLRSRLMGVAVMADGPPGEFDMLAVAQSLAAGVDLVDDALERWVRAILGEGPARGVVVHRVSSVDTASRREHEQSGSGMGPVWCLV